MLDSELDEAVEGAFEKYWEVHSEMMEEHDVAQIAAIIITQGMTMYKTILSPEDYEMMMASIYESRDRIQRLDPEQGMLH